MKRKNILLALAVIVPVLLVFKSFFSSLSLVWGDAPFFYSEGFSELLGEPQAWIQRGNNFGGANSFLFLFPIMTVYGMLNNLFSLGNGEILRILFYFPSLILSLVGPFFLLRYLKFGKTTQFIASLFYVFNTYYLLLIDGGQVGMALAYGLFPFSVLFLKKLVDAPTHKRFLLSLAVSLLLMIVDPRVLAMSFLTVIVFSIFERLVNKKPFTNIKYLFFQLISLFGVGLYWIYPFLKFGGLDGGGVLNVNPISIKNTLLIFQPHFPLNEFGNTIPTPLYYLGIPLLVFGGLIKRRKNIVYGLLFFVFAFLAKGNSEPFGQIYNVFVNKVPFGVVFRDSSKFYIPLIFFGGILMGQTLEVIQEKFKKQRKAKVLVSISLYLYLLFLILPALTGKLNFVLSNRRHSADLEVIKENLVKEESFSRTAWFPEKNPLSFHLEDIPALDAKKIINLRPIYSMNVGSYDVFNFFHNERFLDYFDILGIKYLIFPGNQRKVLLSEKEKEEWDGLINLADNIKELERLDWGTEIPIFKLPTSKPNIYAVDKLIGVVGSDNLYERKSLKLDNVGFVYFEDGVFDPDALLNLSPESVDIYLNEKQETDLVLSFLQDYFVSAGNAKKSEWAMFSSAEYLTWKYQLLIRGISVNDMNYSASTALSTNKGETLEHELMAKEKGEYVLAIRSLKENDESILEYSLNGNKGNVEIAKIGSFEWFVKNVSLKRGKHKLILENGVGLSSVNIVSLIPKLEYDESIRRARIYLDEFGSISSTELDILSNNKEWVEVKFEEIIPTKYKITTPKGSNWIILTDSYNEEWKLKKGVKYYSSLPVYSSLNAFYIEDAWTGTEIAFGGQKHVRTGLYFSSLSIIILAIVYFWKLENNNEKK